MNLLCKWCDEEKAAEDFIRRKPSEPYSQSNVRCCKACNAARNRDRYKTIPAVRAVQQVANARWAREHRDAANAAHERFNARNPFNQQARNRVNYLLRRGLITRQPCCVCGTAENIEAHHDSYAREDWDVVRWLCKAHHERWHQHLDPLKAPLTTEALQESAIKREKARMLLDEVHKMRKQVTALQADADELETSAWAQVKAVAEREFQAFLSDQ